MATPFTIKIEQSAIDDLKRRLERTRLPDHIAGSHWDYGTEPSYLQVMSASDGGDIQCFLFRHAWCVSISATSMMHLTILRTLVGIPALLPLICQQ